MDLKYNCKWLNGNDYYKAPYILSKNRHLQWVGLSKTPNIWCKYCGCRFAANWKYKSKICKLCWDKCLNAQDKYEHPQNPERARKELFQKMFQDGDPTKEYIFTTENMASTLKNGEKNQEIMPHGGRPYRPKLCLEREEEYLQLFINQQKTKTQQHNNNNDNNHAEDDRIGNELPEDASLSPVSVSGLGSPSPAPTTDNHQMFEVISHQDNIKNHKMIEIQLKVKFVSIFFVVFLKRCVQSITDT